MRLVQTARALEQRWAITAYLAGESGTVANRFIDSFDHSCADLLELPEIGSPVSALPGGEYRQYSIRGFKHHRIVYFYDERAGQIILLWVVDVRSNPETLYL